MLWVNYELTGYPSVDVLPEYRKKQGQLKGTYLKGSMANHMKYTNVSIPIGKMPDHIAKVFLEIPFTEGVVPVDTLCFQNREEIFCHGIVIRVAFT